MLSSLVVQLLLMNNGIHFSTFPVSNTAEIQQICESQLSGEVILFSFVGPIITSLVYSECSISMATLLLYKLCSHDSCALAGTNSHPDKLWRGGGLVRGPEFGRARDPSHSCRQPQVIALSCTGHQINACTVASLPAG